MSMVLLRRKKDNLYQQEQPQLIAPIQENRTKEDQEWEMIKEKYDYDELEPERQQILEQQFREMIYKRRMSKIEVDDITEDTEMTENIERSGRRMK